MKKYLLIIVFYVFLLPSIAHANYDLNNAKGFAQKAALGSGITEESVESVAAKGLKAAISIVGIFFLILMVYGGFLWMTARGNEEQITKARNTIIAALIGVFVVVGAYAITNYAGRIMSGHRASSKDYFANPNKGCVDVTACPEFTDRGENDCDAVPNCAWWFNIGKDIGFCGNRQYDCSSLSKEECKKPLCVWKN